MVTSKPAKKFGRKAQKVLMSTSSCSLTQMMAFQEAIDYKDDDLLRAILGLTGGMFSKGSTCGVVFSGALTLAMLLDPQISEWGPAAEIQLHSMIKEYYSWFDEKYGTTLCRERTGLNLWTLRGVMGLNLPHILYKCMSQTGGAAKYLVSKKERMPEIAANLDASSGSAIPSNFHCAQRVLEKIRTQTEIGHSVAERISVALDGGVGLQGGACGAMAGAVMAIGLHLAKDVKKIGMVDLMKSPKKLRKQESFNEFYSVGGKLMTSFVERMGSMECKDICNRTFNSWEEFQAFGGSGSSKVCHELIEFAANTAIDLINKSTE